MKYKLKNIGCVIMASGLGKRFGGNKLMADFNGKPIIQCVLENTEELFAKRVVVTRNEDIVAFCKQWEVPVLFHQLPGRNDTIRLGLEELGMDMEGCFFCPSDQPLLKKETLRKMIKCVEENSDLIYRPIANGIMGAPVYFPAWTFEELSALPKGKGGSVVIKKYIDKVAYIEASELELKDIDTVEDLLYLKEYIQK